MQTVKKQTFDENFQFKNTTNAEKNDFLGNPEQCFWTPRKGYLYIFLKQPISPLSILKCQRKLFVN